MFVAPGRKENISLQGSEIDMPLLTERGGKKHRAGYKHFAPSGAATRRDTLSSKH